MNDPAGLDRAPEAAAEPATQPAPRLATRLARLRVFFGRMFPPALMLPASVAAFAAIYLTLQALAGDAPARVTWRAWVGSASLLLFSLLMRLYDELKDVETDLALGRAGDPRYRDRPIVTGQITVADLVLLRRVATGLLLALNAPLGFPLPFLAFAGVFALQWLSSRWFFYPAMSRNLLLAFATHNPISLASAGYVAAVFAADFGAARLGPMTLPLLLGLWGLIAAWEISRKVRAPADETSYVTYSKVLGFRTAALVTAFLAIVSAALLLATARAAGLAPWTGVAIAATALVLAARSVLFALAPTTARAKLEPLAEIHLVVANLALAAGAALRSGVAFG